MENKFIPINSPSSILAKTENRPPPNAGRDKIFLRFWGVKGPRNQDCGISSPTCFDCSLQKVFWPAHYN